MYNSDVSEQFLVFQLKTAGISDASRTLACIEGNLKHYYRVQGSRTLSYSYDASED
jgi:hypothetical protein